MFQLYIFTVCLEEIDPKIQKNKNKNILATLGMDYHGYVKETKV